MSSLGKGIVAASLGCILKSRGLSVAIQKFDPYLNVDPGTMSPFQHGEVFVTEDGGETDLDLGHYERFLNQDVSKVNNVTSGMIFWEVLQNERSGRYLGSTVQIIPHITNAIKDRIVRVSENMDVDVIITEIGGTVGDIESLPFLEAIRQFQFENKPSCLHIHVTLVPYLMTSGEYKTKPTQHSIKELREIGIMADVIVCRVPDVMGDAVRDKIAMFCDVDKDAVIPCPDANSIYEVPLHLVKERLDLVVLKKLSLSSSSLLLSSESTHSEIPSTLDELKIFTNLIRKKENLPKVIIAVVGKYTQLSDAYLSIVEAIQHASVESGCCALIRWINSESLETGGLSCLDGVHGVLIPGGFGERGIAGKLLAVEYARKKDIPFLGICLGMHVAIIEFARQLGLVGADSTEFDTSSADPVIHLSQDQQHLNVPKGGTMRLGVYPCKVKPGTLLSLLHGEKKIVYERHRHRYEFNNLYRDTFEKQGAVFSGESLDGTLVEVFELPSQRWFLACQYHPEFKSRPLHAHPLFFGLVNSAKAYLSEQI